jgi:glutamate-1-semialdehyde 2,1-aminomutase
VTADLCTFGKALANGFSVSALVGRRELMRLGGNEHDRERVFLLSTTHGAETHALAAALATMRFYVDNPVVETLYARGERLRRGFVAAVAENGLDKYVGLASRDCNLLYFTRDRETRPSQDFRTLFMQELVKCGILAPSFVTSFSHTETDVDRTLDAVDQALSVYRDTIDTGLERCLEGRPVKPVFRRYA